MRRTFLESLDADLFSREQADDEDDEEEEDNADDDAEKDNGDGYSE